MALEIGDLVACYVTNTSEYESLLSWGVVLDINKAVEDVLVVDNVGDTRWWPCKRWRVLKKKKSNNFLDLDTKLV
jgi:hypothetical protein